MFKTTVDCIGVQIEKEVVGEDFSGRQVVNTTAHYLFSTGDSDFALPGKLGDFQVGVSYTMTLEET